MRISDWSSDVCSSDLFRFGGALVEFGDMRAAAISVFFPAVQSGGKDGFQPLGLKKLLLKVIDDQIVQLLHRHGHAGAGGRSLPGLHRAGIVAIAPALAGADGHGPADRKSTRLNSSH